MSMSLSAIVDREELGRLGGLLRVAKSDERHVARGKRLLLGLFVRALAGAVAALVALLRGHHVMGTTSEISWGVLIATYVFFVVSSTGLCVPAVAASTSISLMGDTAVPRLT